MTPIEIIEARYGYDILTGNTETDISDLNVVAIVIRSPGAKLAKLEIGTTDVLASRTGIAATTLDVTDVPILAGYDIGERTTLKFTNIQLTNEADSVSLIFGKPE